MENIAKHKKEYLKAKKILGLNSIVSVSFSDEKKANCEKYKDTACTALARSLRNGISTYIDRKTGQLCSGGDYILAISEPAIKEVCEIYVKKERVFKNNKVCVDFLRSVPAYPASAKKRYIILIPLSKETKEPDVIIFLATPAQAGRVLGLNVYKGMSAPLVIPALSTCASVFAPLATKQICLNFIDYYDRCYQGRQKKCLIWKDSELIVSATYKQFLEIIKNIPNSAHGSFKPLIKPQKFDKLLIDN